MIRIGQSVVAGLALGLVAAAVPAATRTYEMRFWYDNEAAARAAGARQFEDHPCGAIAIMRVERMPAYARGGALEPELVVEYGEGRRELRRWSAPVDGDVQGIRDDQLLIYLAGRFYWIGTDGRISPTRNPATQAITQDGQCGTPAGLDNSDYAFCRAYRDLRTGSLRNIFLQGVCT